MPRDPIKQRAASQKARKRTSVFLKNIAGIYGCQVCDEGDVSCIDFHHKNPLDKEADVHYMIKNKWAPERIVTELKKCVPLCSNCHRKLHAGRLQIEETNLKTIKESSLQIIKDMLKG